MSVTWLDWFSWTRCKLQRKEFKRAGHKLPGVLKTPEGVMRILSDKMSAKAREMRRSSEVLPEYERLLSILFPYFNVPVAPDEDVNSAPINMRIEQDAVEPLMSLQLGPDNTADWLELCHEHPLIYIDFPMNAWMLSANVQVSAIFIDNGIAEAGEVGIFFDDEPRSTVAAILSLKNERSKRRLVWRIGQDSWHDDLAGINVDELEGKVPTAAAMIEAGGLDPLSFCRRIEQMIAAALFQRHALRAARIARQWVGRLPSDPARQAAFIRQNNSMEIRSLFRIERIGIVPEEARRRLPAEAIRGARGPLMSPVWVRAHLRNQRCGPGLVESRPIWIKAHAKGPEHGMPRHSMSLIQA